MPHPVYVRWYVAVAVVLLHGLLAGWRVPLPERAASPPRPVMVLRVLPDASLTVPLAPSPPRPPTAPARSHPGTRGAAPAAMPVPPTPVAAPRPVAAAASMAAPPPPTEEEWALAARYPLKNGKRYRHAWSQQVRSMMGTALTGPDQGAVRFRIEIGADGRLHRLETLWSTSPVAERLARQAVAAMPALPPTPTGAPLVFEQTISFQPYETDGPPVYRNDCRPDPPVFRNAFAWNGRGAAATPRAAEAPSAPAMPLEDCLKLLPPDTPDAEAAHDRHQIERWRASRLDG